jgi:hypothetical protein
MHRTNRIATRDSRHLTLHLKADLDDFQGIGNSLNMEIEVVDLGQSQPDSHLTESLEEEKLLLPPGNHPPSHRQTIPIRVQFFRLQDL